MHYVRDGDEHMPVQITGVAGRHMAMSRKAGGGPYRGFNWLFDMGHGTRDVVLVQSQAFNRLSRKYPTIYK